MTIFNSIGHAFAWVLSKMTSGAIAVGADADSPVATAIVAATGTTGSTVQADIEAVAGCVVAAATAAGTAVLAGGLNITFDAAALAAIGRLTSTVGGLFGKPAAAAAPAPAPTAAAAATA